MHRLILLSLGLLLALTSGCHRAASPRALTAAQRDEIQSRVTNHFAAAVMFKPTESGFESDLTAQLAPLLLQAVVASNAASLWMDRPAPASARPLIYVHTNEVILNSNRYAQFSYTWNYPPPPPATPALATQGVRITLDARGAPAIWEVLTESTGADVIYVAQSVEVMARAEFGPPLAGRKFAVERAVAPAHPTVVANIIDDGPVAMGPILYLQAGSRDVSALICRCMPAQFRELSGQQDYQLSSATAESGGFAKNPLDQRLRLPSRF